MGALPVDLSAVGALPELVVVAVGVGLEFVFELLFGYGCYECVAEGAMGLVHIDLKRQTITIGDLS